MRKDKLQGAINSIEELIRLTQEEVVTLRKMERGLHLHLLWGEDLPIDAKLSCRWSEQHRSYTPVLTVTLHTTTARHDKGIPTAQVPQCLIDEAPEWARRWFFKKRKGGQHGTTQP